MSFNLVKRLIKKKKQLSSLVGFDIVLDDINQQVCHNIITF